MRHGYLALLLGGLTAVLALVPGGLLPPPAAADTPLPPGHLVATSAVYLPCVAREHQPLQPAGPLPPVQVAPANGATLGTISPSFTINNGGTGQRARAELQFAPVPDFGSDADGLGFSPFQGASTVPLSRNLNEGTTYYWRARSSLDGVNWGEWSAVWSFITPSGGSLPGAPALISPANQSTIDSLRPTLTWSHVTGATRYAVAVGGAVFFSSLSGYAMSFDLDPGTSYGWSVTARNSYGWGTRSNEWAFTTPPVPGVTGAGDTRPAGSVAE